MATYYKWRKSTIRYRLAKQRVTSGSFTASDGIVYFADTDDTDPEFNTSTGKFSLTYDHVIEIGGTYRPNTANLVCGGERNPTEVYGNEFMQLDRNRSTIKVTPLSGGQTFNRYYSQATAGTSQGYVYSTSSSAYPNGGESGSYYYDQRTTVISPTVASNLTYSDSINMVLSSSVQLQWTSAQSNTDYPVTEYEISYAINNTDSWQVAGTTGVLTYEFSNIPEEATLIAFRVRAKDSNNQYGDYVTGTYSVIIRDPPITVTTRTIEMNYFNGTDYEILYPVVGSEVYNHVKFGNYVGSGQYGQSNPNKLELEFTPKMAMITKTSGIYDTYLLNGKTVSYVQSSSGVSEITVEWTGKTVSWYSADSVEAQLNENGVLYTYVVFG